MLKYYIIMETLALIRMKFLRIANSCNLKLKMKLISFVVCTLQSHKCLESIGIFPSVTVYTQGQLYNIPKCIMRLRLWHCSCIK